MKKLLILLLCVIFLYGCAPCECPECPVVECPDCPVIECPEFDQSKCPKEKEFVDVEVYKYVCDDDRIVNAASDCNIPVDFDYKPVMTNEEGTTIEEATIKPSCNFGYNGGHIFFDLGSIASEITVQIKEAGGEFENKLILKNLYSGHRYFAIDANKYTDVDFILEGDTLYVMRLKFDTSYGTQYSNEHIVDTRAGSDYMMKDC